MANSREQKAESRELRAESRGKGKGKIAENVKQRRERTWRGGRRGSGRKEGNAVRNKGSTRVFFGFFGGLFQKIN
jgi:hypothetical protein